MSHISVMAICTSRKDQGPSEGVHNGSSGVPMSCTQPGVSKMSDGAPAATSSPWQRDWGGSCGTELLQREMWRQGRREKLAPTCLFFQQPVIFPGLYLFVAT